jgi:hypothetical protein
MIERHFVERSCRRKRGNVSADAFLNLVGTDDHGHGVPPHQALDAALHFLTAGEWGLGLRVDRILVGSRRRERKIHSRGATRMQRQLLQQPPRPLRSALREYIVERVQPLARFQDFNTVRLLRLSHSDLTCRNAILHHKQLGRILLGCNITTSAASIRRCASPAMESGISNHDWTMEELCELLPQPIPLTQGVEKNLVFKAPGA